MSFFRRVHKIIKQMAGADSRRYEEANTYSNLNAATHLTIHRNLGNLR